MSAGDPPTGVVTFLFTDIEGSTRRWESDADAMRSALAAHDEVLRTAIESHGGFLFKHTGDGVCAAFDSPSAAVDAAVDAQRTVELPVRMGLATGEAEHREGDYFGAVLNRVSRVMAAGHGGQILVADSTAGLIGGVELIDLGPRRLRDVSQPITVWQLVAPGLRAEFPPLRTADAGPGNLRTARGRLIGRDADVTEVVSALQSHRLVTLAGVGGVGKTRLALEVASALRGEFRDGIWVFELASVLDPAAVPDAVAAVLGITQQPGKTVSESVATALEGRDRLLVFDNCEHVVDAAAALVEAILAQSTTVAILTTSREGLGLPDERLRRVPSLDIASAVELFAARAKGSGTDDDRAVEEVCRRLDGIPLAIELAASRTESMTAAEMRDRLDHRFRLLVGSRRGIERHQTLRHAVAWSYDLLDDAERALLERCSVFTGGFDVRSACAVADSDDEFGTLDLLDALVRKSLVVADRSGGRTRFSMLETIRQFAEEKLVERGEGAETSRRHARHFADREPELLKLWDSPRQREAHDWFVAELANVRTAFRWAADNHELDVAIALTTLAGLLGLWVENYEAATWAEELIESAHAAEHERLALLYLVATMCHFGGRYEDGVRFIEAAHSAMRETGTDAPFSVAGLLASVYLSVGRVDLWAAFCRARLHEACDTHGFSTSSLVMALANLEQYDEAKAIAEGLLDKVEATGNPSALAYALLAYGVAFRNVDPVGSLAATRRSLRIAQDHGISASESIQAMTLSKLETDHGDRIAALDCAMIAIRNYHHSGNVSVMGVPLCNLAYLFDRLGRHEQAATIFGYGYNPMAAVTGPGLDQSIAHLREVLGDQAYQSFADAGRAMTLAAIATYAYEQIEAARAQLEQLR